VLSGMLTGLFAVGKRPASSDFKRLSVGGEGIGPPGHPICSADTASTTKICTVVIGNLIAEVFWVCVI
jgi:hypothetical protein